MRVNRSPAFIDHHDGDLGRQFKHFHERLRLAARRAVADGDGFNLTIFLIMINNAAAASRISPALEMAQDKSRRYEAISPDGQADDLCNRCENRINRQHIFAAQRRGQRQFAQVVGKNTDGFRISALLVSMRKLHFNRRTKQALVTVLNRQTNLLRRRTCRSQTAVPASAKRILPARRYASSKNPQFRRAGSPAAGGLGIFPTGSLQSK